jgi:uncharacterized Fe-S cluster-containing radical SAM superfamily protein
MSTVIRIDDDVRNELVRKAVDLNMVFSTPNEVLKVILGLTKSVTKVINSTFPHSENPVVQELIEGLRDTIFNLSPNGLIFHSKSDKWVASPNNFVTIKVQDKRKSGLAITVYGNPDKFGNIPSDLVIKPDRRSYSRFNIDRENQLQ